jgi:hypothetical protein
VSMIRRNWTLRAIPSAPDAELSVSLANAFNRQPGESFWLRRSAQQAAYFYERNLGMPVMLVVIDKRESKQATSV